MMVAQPKEPIFRLIIDELVQSTDHKVKALSHIADLHALVSKTIKWDERFIAGLTEVLETAATAEADALDAGMAEIVSKYAPKNGDGQPRENLKAQAS